VSDFVEILSPVADPGVTSCVEVAITAGFDLYSLHNISNIMIKMSMLIKLTSIGKNKLSILKADRRR
jgi:hypothetical protein